jgi:hypothetical protein
VPEIIGPRIRQCYQITGTPAAGALVHHSAGYQAQGGPKLIITHDETHLRNRIGQEKTPINAAE